MPKAPIEGYEEFFLTNAEKRYVADLAEKQNLTPEQKRNIARGILSRGPKLAPDVRRLDRMTRDTGEGDASPQEET